MSKIYALRELYLTEKLCLVILLEPEPLAEALEHLERGEVKEAVASLREATTVYAGEVDTPPGRLYDKLADRGWTGRISSKLLSKAQREALEDYEAPNAVYPVLTGREGLTLVLAVDAWHPEAGDTEGHVLVHLDPELLPKRASVKI